MAKKVIKVNSNPNKTPASGVRNPTQKAIGEAELRDIRQDYLGSKESTSKKTIKVNSNPVKPGKTVVSSMARGVGQGGIAGLALSAVAAYNQQVADLAKRKREIS